jgi:hypothetical protein
MSGQRTPSCSGVCSSNSARGRRCHGNPAAARPRPNSVPRTGRQAARCCSRGWSPQRTGRRCDVGLTAAPSWQRTAVPGPWRAGRRAPTHSECWGAAYSSPILWSRWAIRGPACSSIGSGEWEIPSALRVLESSSALRAGGILSVGASRQGLPFHYHGSTWEGVVQGRKLVVLVRAVTPDLSRGHDAVLRALLAPPTDDRLQLLAQVSGGWMAPSVTIPSHSLTHRTSAHRHAPQRPLSMTQSWGHAEANLLQSKSHVAPGTDWLWPVCWAELAI